MTDEMHHAATLAGVSGVALYACGPPSGHRWHFQLGVGQQQDEQSHLFAEYGILNKRLLCYHSMWLF